MPRREIWLGVILALILIPCALLVWEFEGQQPQPAHMAMARVVAVAPTLGRSGRQTIVVRNAHGTGQISVKFGEGHCNVGDEVVVEQRGVTLTRTPTTCR